MWTEGAAITRQLSDEDVERASTKRKPHSFLHDLDPDARRRLDELQEQIDSGDIKLRKVAARPGRPATDGEHKRRHRREPPKPRVFTRTKADRALAALRADPDVSCREVAEQVGASTSYVKSLAVIEGLQRRSRVPHGASHDDDRLYFAWGLLHFTSASCGAIAEEAGLSAETIQALAARYDTPRPTGRKPKAPRVRRHKGQPRKPRVETRDRIVDLVLGGCTVEQAAFRLRIPVSTVRFYCRTSPRILAADDRREPRAAGPIARDDQARAQGAA